jgi:STE24 endopeptidase
MWILVALLLTQFAISTLLSELNLAHLRRKANDPPPEWAERLDISQFPKMVAYTRARTRLGHGARLTDLGLTLAILLSGFLAGLARWSASLPVAPVWQGLVMLGILGGMSYVASVPWDLASSFGVERKFGFSTIAVKTWSTDQIKSLLISLVLGVVLGGGLLWMIGGLGRWWWLPAWGAFSLFQLLMTFIAPVLILPLFNKFEPLEDEQLRKEIEGLAAEADFPLEGVYQIDASLRSTHSNAYFTGLGKTRRIALFDTLLEQLSHRQILAVLAHEIGHWKKRHVVYRIGAGILLSGAGMVLVALLLDVPWLYQTIGLTGLYAESGTVGAVAAVGLYLVSVLLSPLGLLLSPLSNWVSRRHEYAADRYALDLYGNPEALADGLIELTEKNLSNLFPHPLVVIFRYSHPPLTERVASIEAQVAEA